MEYRSELRFSDAPHTYYETNMRMRIVLHPAEFSLQQVTLDTSRNVPPACTQQNRFRSLSYLCGRFQCISYQATIVWHSPRESSMADSYPFIPEVEHRCSRGVDKRTDSLDCSSISPSIDPVQLQGSMRASSGNASERAALSQSF